MAKKFSDDQRKTIVKELVTNCECFKGDEKTLNEMDDEALEKVNNLHTKSVAVTNAQRQEIDTLKAASEPKAITMEDLPVEMQEDIAFARNAKQAKRTELIQRLVANISDETTRKAHAERLSKRSLADLEADIALLPTTNQEPQRQPLASYLGQAVGQIQNREKVAPPKEPLGIPVWNYDSEN